MTWPLIFAGTATGGFVAMFIMGFDGWLFGASLLNAFLVPFSLWYERRERRRQEQVQLDIEFDASIVALYKHYGLGDEEEGS